MLGKGLEALIPPSRKSDAGGQISGGGGTSDIGNQALSAKSNFQSPASSFERPKQEAVFHIEVEKIKPNPHQPRKNFDEESIKELAASIREFGILQPLVVSKVEKETPTGADVEYQLIAGERRFLAAKYLGLERVPVIIRNVDLERERLELAIIENIQRENLNPIEIARAFSRLQDEFGLAQREIALRVGKSRETVANTVRLLSLPTFIQQAIEKGEISESHGRLLLAVSDPAVQQKLFSDLLEKRITTRELKGKIENFRNQGSRKSSEAEDIGPELKIIQEKLSSELGAPVEVQKRGESGKITITFYSDEELKNIVRKLGKEEFW